MSILLAKHFYKYMIRDVPTGHVLSADTQDQYNLKWSGSYISIEGYIITPSIVQNGKYSLLPNTNDFSSSYFNYPDYEKLHDNSLDEIVRHYLILTGKDE